VSLVLEKALILVRFISLHILELVNRLAVDIDVVRRVLAALQTCPHVVLDRCQRTRQLLDSSDSLISFIDLRVLLQPSLLAVHWTYSLSSLSLS